MRPSPQPRVAARRWCACRLGAAAVAAFLLGAYLRKSVAEPQETQISPGWLLDLRAPSAVHGWVEKAGPAAVEVWHSSADARRRSSWDRFLARRASGQIPLDLAYPGVPPHGPDRWGCRLYFNHRYKIFFVRTAKTGSTTIMEHVLPAYVDQPGLAHCLERVADTNMSVEEVGLLWRRYTAFTFTRNVWSRAISQHQYLVRFLKTSDAAGGLHCPRVPWAEFCRDPLALGAVCREASQCCLKPWTHQDWHMRQQTACLLTDDDPGGWAVDFIGRLEHFEEDLNELFATINSKRSKGLPPMKYIPQPPSNSNPTQCTDGDSGDLGASHTAADQSLDAGERVQSSNPKSGRAASEELAGGSQESALNYCTKELFLTGRYALCFSTVARFFATDVALLHGNLTTSPARERLAAPKAHSGV